MWRIYFLLLFEAALASTFVPPEFEHLALVVRDVANHTISSEGLEIHSFRGGRKKRYVFERAEESGPCCDEKRCRSLRGEFLDKKCRCKKCPKCKKMRNNYTVFQLIRVSNSKGPGSRWQILSRQVR